MHAEMHLRPSFFGLVGVFSDDVLSSAYDVDAPLGSWCLSDDVLSPPMM